MKRVVLSLSVLMLVVVTASGPAFAQAPGSQGNQNTNRCGERNPSPPQSRGCYPPGNPDRGQSANNNNDGGGGGGGGGSFTGSTPAAAPTSTPTATASPTSPTVTADRATTAAVDQGRRRRGQPVRVSGAGFVPGSRVTIRVGGRQLSIGRVGPDGTVSRTIRIPGYLEAGEYTVTIEGGGRSASTTLTVVVPTRAASAFEELTGGTLTVGSLLAMLAVFALASFGLRRYLSRAMR